MISEKMTAALNEQINKELFSAYLYLAMGAYCTDEGLSGFGKWFAGQAKEEVEHAMKFVHYMDEQGARVEYEAIAKPPKTYKSVVEVFEQTVKHEEAVTRSIYGLVDLAIEEKDHATQSFLKWFVDEQVEEEASVRDILTKLNMIGDKGQGLIMMDVHMGKRGD